MNLPLPLQQKIFLYQNYTNKCHTTSPLPSLIAVPYCATQWCCYPFLCIPAYCCFFLLWPLVIHCCCCHHIMQWQLFLMLQFSCCFAICHILIFASEKIISPHWLLLLPQHLLLQSHHTTGTLIIGTIKTQWWQHQKQRTAITVATLHLKQGKNKRGGRCRHQIINNAFGGCKCTNEQPTQTDAGGRTDHFQTCFNQNTNFMLRRWSAYSFRECMVYQHPAPLGIYKCKDGTW